MKIASLQVLDIREKELGPDHVDVAASLNNIAVLLKTSGQFEEAEEMYNRSIAIKENALGPNHPQVPLQPLCIMHAAPQIQFSLSCSYRNLAPRGPGVPNRSKQLAIARMHLAHPVKPGLRQLHA